MCCLGKPWLLPTLLASVAVMLIGAHSPRLDEYKSGIVWPEPPVINPGDAVTPPSDAIVLFNGDDLSAFNNGDKWLIEDGYAQVRGGGITSKQAFGDCQLHLEFATPTEVVGEGQGRGNSGVYLMGKYEVQILDSYNNATYFDGQCAAVYKQQPPTVNACRGPGEWQTYDIIFEAPRFDAEGKVTKPAYVTVLHNGIVVQNHFELPGGTFWHQPPKYEPHAEKLPLHIQDHGNPMRFRNIWIRENIQPLVGQKPVQAKTENNPEPTSTAAVNFSVDCPPSELGAAQPEISQRTRRTWGPFSLSRQSLIRRLGR